MLAAKRSLTGAAIIALLASLIFAIPARAEEAQNPPDSAELVATSPVAPTYRVFATRQGLVGHRTANGHRIRPRDRFVALPSWSSLSSRDGYEFQVRVTYGERSVVLPVWDVGPWNTHDDYWSPNRRYSDLAVGVPMAQAARLDGYNNGRDEFGRRIRLPNGIDIADGAFWDDLGMTDSDWVEVSFLWLGADPVEGTSETASATDDAAIEPGAIVVDDGASGFAADDGDRWYDAACGVAARHVWTYGTPNKRQSTNRAVWKPELQNEGFYEVFAFIPSCGPTPTEQARYQIAHSGATTEVTVNQAAAIGGWASLGIYHMGGDSRVILTDVTGDDGRVVRFDAIKWVARADTAPPEARVAAAEPQADGAILVRWEGRDDVSGIASFDIQVRRLPDGGWTNWQMGVAHRETLFVPPEPGSYAFRARARDWVGSEQPWRDTDDLQIEVK